MANTLGERLKLALDGPPKLSQAALARACGVKPPSVNDWITGKTKTIEGANLLNAAAFLNVAPRWLAEGIGPMRPQNMAQTFDMSVNPVTIGLGLRLESARLGKGLTQDAVADQIGVNKATISAWEKGKHIPNVLQFRDLAKLYDVSADSLLWEDSLSPEAMQFAAEFDSLNEAQKRTLHAMWMAYIRESASDSQVETRMPATKTGPGSYQKQNQAPPLIRTLSGHPGARKAEGDD